MNTAPSAEPAGHHHPAKDRIRQLIEEIGCCPHGCYCTLKEILIRAPRDVRVLVQIKCIEKFKYERSADAKKDIGWEEAFRLWVDEGHAAAFARHFDEGAHFGEVYRAVMDDAAKRKPG